jgi:hypothetical protein
LISNYREERFLQGSKDEKANRDKKLWHNTIPLNQYNGEINVDLKYIIQRRKIRYEEEEELFNCYGYYYLMKEVEPIIKCQDNKFYSEPRERRTEKEDCECEAQTIYDHSKEDESCAAADTKVSSIKTNGRQT